MSDRLPFRKTIAEIDLGAIRHNFTEIKRAIGPMDFLCPMIKANAYGHGDVPVARALISTGAERLGVCLIEEGVRLRENNIKVPILVFDVFDRDGIKPILDYELTPVLSTWDQLKLLREATVTRPIQYVHLKFNTGMNRLGFNIEDAKAVYEFIRHNQGIHIQGICTHLRNGDDAGEEDSISSEQIKKLLNLKSIFSQPGIKFHGLNSSAIFNLVGRNKTTDFKELGARPGLCLYGIIPETKSHYRPNLKPVMQIKSKIIISRFLEPGEKVSYSGRWTASQKAVVGVVPVGYEDGYLRNLSNRSYMLFRGQRVPVIGTVCMDYTMVDLTMATGGELGQIGEEIIIMGSQDQDEISASQLGEWANTISYEVLTSVGDRVQRIYVR